ncbi:MAG: autotransporter outer membrane beta-barrel domain-containing protein [Dinoroseobacter sp.]|nr:autotransporter outer membrane beta-barrel domain-containing protein [Dinoroseobacter sp.]
MIRTRPLAATTACIFMSCATLASAQQVNFGPDSSPVVAGAVTFNVSVPAGDTGDQSLNLIYAGDLGRSQGTFGERIEVFVEGTSIATLPPPALDSDCVITYNSTLTVPASVYDAAAADGSVTIVLQASSAVDPICGTPIPYSAPFTSFNSASSSIVAQGSLTVSNTGGAAPTALLAEEMQRTMAATRGAMILANGPAFQRRIDRLKGTSTASRGLTFEGNQLVADTPFRLDVGRNEMTFTTAPGSGAWIEGSYTRISDDTSDDQWFGILHGGVDTMVAQGVLVGLTAQLDRLDSTDLASGDEYKGTGWMLGPYVTAQIGQNLFIDGRLTYGTVKTDVDRGAGAGRDSYDSDRALAELAVIGDQNFGNFTFEPRAKLAWYRETSDPYNSVSLGAISKTKVELGQATLGGRVYRPGSWAGGQITPYLDLTAAYTHYDTGTTTSGAFGTAFEGWSGNLGLGIAFAGRGGSEWTVDATYTGAGSGASAARVRAGLILPF